VVRFGPIGTVVRLSPKNAASPIRVKVDGSVMEVRVAVSRNAQKSIPVTPSGMLTEVREVFAKAKPGIVDNPVPRVNDVNGDPWKVVSPIDVTELGIEIDVKPEVRNAMRPIEVSDVGKVIEWRALVPLKEFSPMLVSEFGSVTAVSAEFPLKTLLATAVTPAGISAVPEHADCAVTVVPTTVKVPDVLHECAPSIEGGGELVPETEPEPDEYPLRVAVTEAVAEAPGVTPEVVRSPELLIVPEPPPVTATLQFQSDS